MPSRFDEFWAAYPRKVGKIAAEKAYRKAVKLASHDEIMDGVRRYLKAKPAYADWCHPATWLCQGRWMDEPDTKPVNGNGEMPLENAAWRIRYGTGDGFKMEVSKKQARECIDAGLVTEEQAKPWL